MSEPSRQDTEERFKLAVDYIAAFLGPAVYDNEIRPLPRFMSHKASLLYLLLVEDEKEQFSFKVSDLATIDNIVRCMQQDPHSYDLVRELVGEGLLQEAGQAINLSINGIDRRSRAMNAPPLALKFIISQMLTGVFQRPKQVGTPTRFGRDVMFYIAIEHACAEFDLPPSRLPDTRPKRSGCDALCEALHKLQVHVPSFDAVRRVWQSKPVREYIGHVREMESAIQWRDNEAAG